VGLHTRATLVDDIVARVEGDRPDAVPCVVAAQLIDRHQDYLQWITHETAGAVDRRAATDARRTERAGGRWHWVTFARGSWHLVDEDGENPDDGCLATRCHPPHSTSR